MPNSSRCLWILLVTSLFLGCSPRDSENHRQTKTQTPPAPPVSPSEQFGRGSCADDPRIGRVGFPGTRPVLLKKVEPSTERIAAGVRGTVILEIIIDPQGIPCSIEVLRSLGRDADEAAVSAVKQWRFIPAELNGEGWPVAYNVTVNIGASQQSAN